MEALFELLEKISDGLEQIHTITQNQTTILLDTKHMGEGLGMIEEMASFKEQLTTQIEVDEVAFQGMYSSCKHELVETEDKVRLKSLVDRIMKQKEYIIQGEQSNVMIMQDLLRRCAEKVEIPKSPEHVVKAYQAQNRK